MSPISLLRVNPDAYTEASATFRQAVLAAFERIRKRETITTRKGERLTADSDAVQFMLDGKVGNEYHPEEKVPIYGQLEPTLRQQEEGGALGKVYLGLWARDWPGYPASPHGIIWVFEQGTRQFAASEGTDLTTKVMEVVLHEFGHALDRDHVLDAMEARRQAAMARPQSGCGSCRGR